jgi:branched-chain amino acid transport system substrate-binding protein
VGGQAKAATGSTIDIGGVNSSTGPAAFPDFQSGMQDAVDYANQYLDGIKGHVVKLDFCSIGSEEDGTTCGTQMVNNPSVQAILEGVLVEGGDTFFKVINNTKTVLQVSANSSADLFPYPNVSQPNVFNLNAGAVGGYDAQLSYLGKDLTPKPKNILFVADKDPATTLAIQTFEGQLKQYNIPTKAIYLTPGAGEAQDAAQIQGGGGNTASVWFFLTDIDTCVNAIQYAQQANVSPVLIGAECIGSAMKPVTGAYAPKGLVQDFFGASYWLPEASGSLAPVQELINAVINQKQPNPVSPDSISLGFEQTLNLIKAMNAATDDTSTQAISTAIKGLQAPVLDNIGTLSCGNVPTFVTLCGNQVGLIETQGNDKWTLLSPTNSLPVYTVWNFKS